MVSTTREVNRQIKDRDDRTVQKLDVEECRRIIAEALKVDDRHEVKFFASRFDGFLGARVMRKSTEQTPPSAV